MTPYNEIYVPTGWNKTSKIIPYNPARSVWPEVSNIKDNIFDLSIITYNKIEDDLMDCDEQLTLFFVHGNNEIVLREDTSYTPRQLVDDQKENINESGTIKEKTYLLTVVDKETKATMYYDVKLARVEMEKSEEVKIENTDSLSEHLEVIAKLDDDNPFDTDFDEPIDKEEKDK